MRAGGWFGGVMALVTVAVIGSQGFWDRIVTVNVWRFVPVTGSNVHVAAPELVGSPSRSIESAPVHVPVRNDCWAVGDVGTGVPPPHAPARHDAVTKSDSRQYLVIRALLPRCRSSAGIRARGRTGH